MLKHFKVDPARARVLVPVEFYQMNLIRAVEQARRLDPDLFVDGDDYLPSWGKFARDPIRARGFWTRMLEAMFLGQGNLPEIDVTLQTRDLGDNGFKVVMMFLPGSMTNQALKHTVAMTKQTIRGWEVLEISGAGTYNGRRITNKNAEKVTREVVERCKESQTPLLILSRGMAQRSYSVGDITELYLCYDEGDAGATTQKISRALTPRNEGKVGRIFSLSFDPNRDDKFDTMMIAAAQNYAKRKNLPIEEGLRRVIATVDIFACGQDHPVGIDPDTYLSQILERNSLSRMVGKQADIASLDLEEIYLLATGNANYSRMETTDSAAKGRSGATAPSSTPRQKLSTEDAKLFDRAKKTLTTIVEHLPYLVIMTQCDTIRDTLIACDANTDYRDYVQEEFGVSPDYILGLFDRGVLNYDLASLQKTARVTQMVQE